MNTPQAKSYEFLCQGQSNSIDGDKVFRAIRNGDIEEIDIFIDKFGVDKTFSFEYDQLASASLSNCTVLLAALYAGKPEIATLALSRGATDIMGISVVHSVGLTSDIHPFELAVANQQIDAIESMWTRGVNLETTISTSDETYKSRRSLAESILDNNKDSIVFLESNGLDDIADSLTKRSAPTNKVRPNRR